ncbi:MAG: hypothetical protein KDC87_21065 [Planctomycetes bacterium]|nr:hypothetical protein [Planctomycetota bacterium]MCB9869830.1 hypothetical protein [Planctomycetota bacterium]
MTRVRLGPASRRLALSLIAVLSAVGLVDRGVREHDAAVQRRRVELSQFAELQQYATRLAPVRARAIRPRIAQAVAAQAWHQGLPGALEVDASETGLGFRFKARGAP